MTLRNSHLRHSVYRFVAPCIENSCGKGIIDNLYAFTARDVRITALNLIRSPVQLNIFSVHFAVYKTVNDFFIHKSYDT